MSTLLPGLLFSFVSHFTRATRREMEAMRERRGSFEVVLTDGQRNALDEPEGGASYTFGALSLERGAHSTAQNLINVAISRARGKLIVIADVRYFERRAAGSVVTRMVVRALAVGRREILRK